jgi:hypothetical protein
VRAQRRKGGIHSWGQALSLVALLPLQGVTTDAGPLGQSDRSDRNRISEQAKILMLLTRRGCCRIKVARTQQELEQAATIAPRPARRSGPHASLPGGSFASRVSMGSSTSPRRWSTAAL